MTDLGPPSSSALARVSDRRAAQFWDPGRALSQAIVDDLLGHPEDIPSGVELHPDTVVWDAVLLFDAAARWESRFPRPVFFAFPVVSDPDGLEKALREVEKREGEPPSVG